MGELIAGGDDGARVGGTICRSIAWGALLLRPCCDHGDVARRVLGKAQVKMYDKFGLVLRIETTVNNVAFFKHHRKVEHRDGPGTRRWRRCGVSRAHAATGDGRVSI